MSQKTDKLRESSTVELEKQLRDERRELLSLRMKKHTGQVEHPHMLKQHRRHIARLETLIAEKRAADAAA